METTVPGLLTEEKMEEDENQSSVKHLNLSVGQNLLNKSRGEAEYLRNWQLLTGNAN